MKNKNKNTNKIRKMHAISSRDVKRKKMMQKKKEKEKRRSLKNLRHGFGGVRKWSTLLERHREESLRINLRQEIRRRS